MATEHTHIRKPKLITNIRVLTIVTAVFYLA
jgi:hypothetical protein